MELLGKKWNKNTDTTLYAIWEINTREISQYVTTGTIVENTLKNDKYIVYNTIDSTPWNPLHQKTIIDWRDETVTDLTKHTNRSVVSNRYNNIDIAAGYSEEVIFIGNKNKTFTNFRMYLCSYTSSQNLTLTFDNFKFTTNENTAIALYAATGINLTINVLGECSISTSVNSGNIINLSGVESTINFIGSGSMSINAGDGSDGSSGTAGGNGGYGIAVKYIMLNMSGSLSITGGDGGNGGDGTGGDGGDGGAGGAGGNCVIAETMWIKGDTILQCYAGSGGDGGAGGDGSDGRDGKNVSDDRHGKNGENGIAGNSGGAGGAGGIATTTAGAGNGSHGGNSVIKVGEVTYITAYGGGGDGGASSRGAANGGSNSGSRGVHNNSGTSLEATPLLEADYIGDGADVENVVCMRNKGGVPYETDSGAPGSGGGGAGSAGHKTYGGSGCGGTGGFGYVSYITGERVVYGAGGGGGIGKNGGDATYLEDDWLPLLEGAGLGKAGEVTAAIAKGTEAAKEGL